jgi:glutamate-1-semialdehyde 2,1-aminomutase
MASMRSSRTPDSGATPVTRYAQSYALHRRACELIPGGAHLSGRALVDVETTPMYFERGSGVHLWDVDGHEYVDFLMSYGSVLLGHAHAEVEEAALAGARGGRLLPLNHPAHVRFVEALLARFPGAEMGTFFRTGSEATTAALRIARRATGRRRVARCGYHGWHDWCLPLEDFVPEGLAPQVLEFCANEPGTLEQLFGAHPNQIAAVIVAPEMVLPHRPSIFQQLARLARAHGAVFIMDEVKTAIRIAPNSISERVGLVPDMLCASKGLGNGQPVAALLGRREVMQAGAGMHYSATFHGDVAAMAAALKTLELVEREGVQAHVDRLGRRLIDGLNAMVRELSVPASAFGEPLPAMPFFRFDSGQRELDARLSAAFYRSVLARGVLLHPRHMWFIAHAHAESDVDRALEVARASLLDVKRALL